MTVCLTPPEPQGGCDLKGELVSDGVLFLTIHEGPQISALSDYVRGRDSRARCGQKIASLGEVHPSFVTLRRQLGGCCKRNVCVPPNSCTERMVPGVS